MNEKPYELLPILGPDGVRKILRANKNLFNSYTKKNYDVTNQGEITNVGTVENFGSELLLESRKLGNERLDFYKNNLTSEFKFYFDPVWSPLTPTDFQRTILQCLLKKNVFLEDCTYDLVFNDIRERYILRSDSTSDPYVKKNKFYESSDVYLKIVDGNNVEKHVKITNNASFVIGFYYNSQTDDYAIINEEALTLIVELDKDMYDMPWLWLYFPNQEDSHQYPIQIEDNFDVNNNTLISLGADGHNVSHGYLSVYGEENIPYVPEEVEGNKWIVKCYTNDEIEQFSLTNRSLNWGLNIVRVDFGYGADARSIDPQEITSLTVDTSTGAKLSLNKDAGWQFQKPSEGDSDYDDLTDHNPAYAYIDLSVFADNMPEDAVLTPAFDIACKERHNETEMEDRLLFNDSKSGMHIDASSEISDNGVSKKNGVIHDLGDFDGLPAYFQYMLPETIHRIHTEIYSINQKLSLKEEPIQRGTAALILDTAIPQIEADMLLDNLNLSITYNYEVGRRFDTTEPPIDEKNALSEVVYVDPYNFGCSSQAKYVLNHKFIYHGNRVFSLGKTGLDPEKEIGRVYYVSNDDIKYKNNELLNEYQKKPGLTLARICDIPTSFLELIQIPYKSPAIVIDELYVRSECSFKESEKYDLWYDKHPTLVNLNGRYIFEYYQDLNTIMGQTWMNIHYPHATNLIGKLNLASDAGVNFVWEVGEPGSGYAPGDILATMVGGQKVEITVHSAPDGELAIIVGEWVDYDFDKSLFPSQYTSFPLSNISSSGSGGTAVLHIYDDKWASFVQGTAPTQETFYALKKDSYENVWVWEYDVVNHTWFQTDNQLTGVKVTPNYYDTDTYDRLSRTTTSTFIRNMLMNTSCSKYTPNIIYNTDTVEVTGIDPNDVETGVDLSAQILHANIQNGSYLLYTESDSVYLKICADNFIDGIDPYTLPRFHNLNVSQYTNHSNKLMIHSYGNEKTQMVPFIYNPFKTTKDHYSSDGKLHRDGNRLISEYYNDYVVGGFLSNNLYEYNVYKMNSDVKQTRELLESQSREGVVYFIQENFPDCHLLDYEGTKFECDKETLIDYAMTNYSLDPLYKKNDIDKLRTMNDKVEESISGTTVGDDEQLTGWFEWVNDYHDPDVKLNGVQDHSERFKVFKLISSTFVNLNALRIYDEYDNDISENVLLIFNEVAYLFSHADQTWFKLHKMEG